MSNLIKDYNKLPKNLWQYKATNANNIWNSNVLKTMSSYKVVIIVIVSSSIHISSKVWMKLNKTPNKRKLFS